MDGVLKGDASLPVAGEVHLNLEEERSSHDALPDPGLVVVQGVQEQLMNRFPLNLRRHDLHTPSVDQKIEVLLLHIPLGVHLVDHISQVLFVPLNIIPKMLKKGKGLHKNKGLVFHEQVVEEALPHDQVDEVSRVHYLHGDDHLHLGRDALVDEIGGPLDNLVVLLVRVVQEIKGPSEDVDGGVLKGAD